MTEPTHTILKDKDVTPSAFNSADNIIKYNKHDNLFLS